MALAHLASAADLSLRYGALDGAVDVALSVASAAVRDAAGVAITEETSTVVVHGGPGRLLRLPGPVTSVASVTVDGDVLDVDSYVVMPEGLWRSGGWASCGVPLAVTVEFTHGLGSVPADVVDLTCQLAKSWLDHADAGGGSVAGLRSVKIDDAAESYTDEAAGQVSPVFIPAVTRNWLARRFGGGAVVVESL